MAETVARTPVKHSAQWLSPESVCIVVLGLYIPMPFLLGAVREEAESWVRLALMATIGLFLYTVFLYILSRRKLPSGNPTLTHPNLGFLILACWVAIRSPSFEALEYAVQILGLGILWTAIMTLRITTHGVVIYTIWGTCVSLIGGMLYVISPKSPIVTDNYMGALLATCSFFPCALLTVGRGLIHKTLGVISLGLLVGYVGYSASRAAFAALSIALLMSLVFVLVPRRHSRLFRIFFSIAILSASLGFVLYLVYIDPLLARKIGDFGRELFPRGVLGKRILSGRQLLWPAVVDLIAARPWLGWGTGVFIPDLTRFQLSAHNLFLQVWLQWGLIGVGLTVYLFFGVVRSFWGLYGRLSSISLAFFLALVLRDMLEVTLLQNNAPLALLVWCVVAFGLAFDMAPRQCSPGKTSRRGLCTTNHREY